MKTWEEVLEKFQTIDIPREFDLIVAIANGGIIPAAILNQRLGKELRLLHIHLRDNEQRPQYDSPRLMRPIDFDPTDKKILLVDDRVKTGSTIIFARELLKQANIIKTFAVNGNADYALYDEACFRFPWLLPN